MLCEADLTVAAGHGKAENAAPLEAMGASIVATARW